MATEKQRWFREIFRGLRAADADALAEHLGAEDRRTEAHLAAGLLDAGLVGQLYAQTDALGLVLRGRLHLEETLEAIIAKRFPHPEILLHARLSFSAKADTLRAAGALDAKTYRDLVHLSRLRNAFAHHLSSALSLSDLSAFSDCAGLEAAAAKFADPDEQAQVAVFVLRQILLQLLLRLTRRHKLSGAN